MIIIYDKGTNSSKKKMLQKLRNSLESSLFSTHLLCVEYPEILLLIVSLGLSSVQFTCLQCVCLIFIVPGEINTCMYMYSVHVQTGSFSGFHSEGVNIWREA